MKRSLARAVRPKRQLSLWFPTDPNDKPQPPAQKRRKGRKDCSARRYRGKSKPATVRRRNAPSNAEGTRTAGVTSIESEWRRNAQHKKPIERTPKVSAPLPGRSTRRPVPPKLERPWPSQASARF